MLSTRVKLLWALTEKKKKKMPPKYKTIRAAMAETLIFVELSINTQREIRDYLRDNGFLAREVFGLSDPGGTDSHLRRFAAIIKEPSTPRVLEAPDAQHLVATVGPLRANSIQEEYWLAVANLTTEGDFTRAIADVIRKFNTSRAAGDPYVSWDSYCSPHASARDALRQ